MTDTNANDNADSQPIVQMQDIHKRYGDLHVLRGISVDVQRGQHVAIIGPSGSGKSTMLRLLMTLEKPSDGRIIVEGEELWHEERNGQRVPASKAHVSRVRGKVGMVFQHFNLFPHMTVIKNVMLAPVRVLGMPKDQARQRAEELLGMVGLDAKVDSYPGSLSGGQKQRVAIARALALQPSVMLFDEVTSALDPELVGEALTVLRQLAADTDMTMLIVTHQMHFAEEIADRVIFFDGGHIIEDDKPEVIFHEPKEERTREFLKAVLDAH